jgi:hypothetical protein
MKVSRKRDEIMNTYEAAQFINGLALKPGWTIRAQGGGYSTVHLAISFAKMNSSEVYAPGYRVPLPDVPLQRSIVVTPSMSKAEIVADVLRLCLETETHEWCEFTRYQDESGRWVAPFHPHRTDGQRNWLTGRAQPRLAASLAA